MRTYIKNHAWINKLLARLYYFFGHNKIICRGQKNRLEMKVSGVYLSYIQIVINGNNNELRFIPNEPGYITHFRKLNIKISGNNNLITIGSHSSGNGLSICIENDNNKIILGNHFTVGPHTELAAIEGTSIEFGDDCQLSANITLRTGDSHSITDLQGRRINPSKSIKIGNHVWIGNTALIFKGTEIGDNSIIAGGSVVGGSKIYPSHCIIGGNPAKLIKEGIDWDRKRLPIFRQI